MVKTRFFSKAFILASSMYSESFVSGFIQGPEIYSSNNRIIENKPYRILSSSQRDRSSFQEKSLLYLSKKLGSSSESLHPDLKDITSDLKPHPSASSDAKPTVIASMDKGLTKLSTVEDHGDSSFVNSLKQKMGSVNETRVTFEELKTGEVPRLFSNLKYVKEESSGKIISSEHSPGSTFSAAALISGTAIGGGVLALPAATAPVGFLPSTAGMVLVWWYMVISGLLIAELSLNRIGETGRSGSGILDLYESNLPESVGFLGKGSYFFLHYAVMVAYLAEGGNNISSALANISPSLSGTLEEIPGSGQLLFTGIIVLALYFSKQNIIEKANNALVAAVFASFVGIISIGSGTADFSKLLVPEYQHAELIVDAFPILFLSLVYHNIVPTIVSQLEGDRTKITTAIVCGTGAPLLMFLAWNAVVLGNVLNLSEPGLISDAVSGNLDPIALLRSEGNGQTSLSTLVSVFSELAITTSVIGFVYGLVDALTDVVDVPKSGPEFEKMKPLLFAGVFLPPLLFSLNNPDIFLTALEYGGAFGVSTLFLVLPPIMVWSVRYGDEEKPLTVLPMTPGGKLVLGSLWKAAGTLILEQGAEKLGVFKWLHETFPIDNLVGEFSQLFK